MAYPFLDIISENEMKKEREQFISDEDAELKRIKIRNLGNYWDMEREEKK
jgi:hypothetical protein